MSTSVLDPALSVGTGTDPVRHGLEAAAGKLASSGIQVPSLAGKLLRPRVAYGLVAPERRARVDAGFWMAALAIEMAHEASLAHDDVLDGAGTRRGRETALRSGGVAHALILGDLYLTGAYCAATLSDRPLFTGCFVDAVERTVRGEAEQARRAGTRLTIAEYERIIRAKSGSLFAAAVTLGGIPSRGEGVPRRARLAGRAREAPLASLSGRWMGLDLSCRDADTPTSGALAARRELGERLGAFYQRIDDLLDYLPDADTGKPPLQDIRQRKWTWVLDLVGATHFDESPETLTDRLFRPDPSGRSGAGRASSWLRRERDALVDLARTLAPGDALVPHVLDGWIERAERAIETQRTALGRSRNPDRGDGSARGSSPVTAARAAAPFRAARGRNGAVADELVARGRALGGPDRWPPYFRRHARTFSLAARLFPEEARRAITAIYVFCRFTDDIVDEPRPHEDPGETARRLELWRGLTEAAWEGDAHGIPVLAEALTASARAGVDRDHPLALLDGVSMDLAPRSYRDWSELEQYTYRVAGALGGWITQRVGIRDPGLLPSAYALGHALQLTNVARDVGEDLGRGRLYLPLALLSDHGLEPADVERCASSGGPPPPAYRAAIETLLRRSDDWYARSWPGILTLPGWYRRPVAVASVTYQAIHQRIRKAGYDNLTRRARTSGPAKIGLACSALLRSVRGASPTGSARSRLDHPAALDCPDALG